MARRPIAVHARATALVVTAALLVACAGRGSSLAGQLGRCPVARGPGPDASWATEHLARTDRWLEVDAVRSLEVDLDTNRIHTEPHRLVVRSPGEATFHQETVVVPGPFLWGLDWVGEHGRARLYLGLQESGLASRGSGFALVLTDDGGVAFAGACEDRELTQPLEDRYGDRLAATLRDAVGKTGQPLWTTLGVPPPGPLLMRD